MEMRSEKKKGIHIIEEKKTPYSYIIVIKKPEVKLKLETLPLFRNHLISEPSSLKNDT